MEALHENYQEEKIKARIEQQIQDLAQKKCLRQGYDGGPVQLEEIYGLFIVGFSCIWNSMGALIKGKRNKIRNVNYENTETE